MINNSIQNFLRMAALATLAAIAAACSADESVPTTASSAGQDPIGAAIASPLRTEADLELDERRKPAKVLKFIGIAAGDAVFEMEAGQGYYSQLFSQLIGPDGELIIQNPASFDAFLGDSLSNRIDGGGLGNARLTKSPFDDLDADDGGVDIVTWLLGPHELYFTPADGANLGSPDGAFSEAFRILKPGGYLYILDHAAAPGTPPESGGSVHRIDPALVKQWASTAGFELVEESDILRNATDDYSMSVFDPKVRRSTDRFLLRFKKPN